MLKKEIKVQRSVSKQEIKEQHKSEFKKTQKSYNRTKELEITDKIILEMKTQLEEAIETIQTVIQRRGGKGVKR